MAMSRFDSVSMVTGFSTMGMGTGLFSLDNVHSILGIIVAGSGLILTVATFIWRRREHRRRMAASDWWMTPEEKRRAKKRPEDATDHPIDIDDWDI